MKLKYTLTGLDCPNCAAKLSAMIEAKDGFQSVKINYLTEKITVETDLSEDEALKVITETSKAFSKSIKVKV